MAEMRELYGAAHHGDRPTGGASDRVGRRGPAQAATVDTNASYVLVNRGSGKALDVSGASTADGAAVHQRARHDGANQRFQFVDSGGGYYRQKARHSGKVLDVSHCSTADHADVVQWSDAPSLQPLTMPSGSTTATAVGASCLPAVSTRHASVRTAVTVRTGFRWLFPA
jgi:hypothetical protein